MDRIHLQVTVCLFVLLVSTTVATIVNNGNTIYCEQANISSVRVEGCSEEPCGVDRGVHIPVEIDFEFQNPNKTDGIAFIVIISAGNGTVPEVFQDGSFITVLAHEIECPKLQISQCPAIAGTRYTMKYTIYVDPNSDEKHTTGLQESGWMLSPAISWFYPQYSLCYFTVKLDIAK